MPANKKKKGKNRSGLTKAQKRAHQIPAEPKPAEAKEATETTEIIEALAGPFKECVDKLGIEVGSCSLSSKKLSLFGQELMHLLEIADKDRTKLFLFRDKQDVGCIQLFQTLQGHEPRECDAVFIWTNIVYYVVPGDKDKTLKEWEFLFSKQRTLECCVCLEDIKRSADIISCHKCHEIRCRACDLKQVKPECPACRAFDLDAYLRHRTVYLNQILMQAGISRKDFETKGGKACEAIVKEKFPCESVDDLLDDMMRACGEKVFDVRDQCKPLF